MSYSNEMKSRIIIHVDMDYFFAQCEERENPEIKGKPVVICVYSGRGGGAVSTSNYEARKLGVKAGIPISLAKKLAPHAIFLPVNMELYHSISDDMMEILKEYSEKIEQESIDEAFCDLTEKINDFEGAKKLAIELKDEIQQKVGLTCSVGLGPNKLVAKIASDHNKPDGLTVVRPEEVLQFLEPLKITDLIGVGKKTGERLNELGVKNIADLSKLTEYELIREFGHAKGIWLKQASRGIDDSPVEERSGTGQIGRIITLKENTKNLNTIYEAVDQLSNDIHMKLQARKLSFRSVSFIAISHDFKTHTRSHTLTASAKDPGTIKTYAHELVKAFLAEHPVALRRVGIRVSNLAEEKGQRTLGEF